MTHKNTFAVIGTSLSLALAATTVQPSAHAAAPHAPAHTSSAPALERGTSTLSDARVHEALTLLERLPSDIKNADPGTTPDYRSRVMRALDDLAGNTPGNAHTYVNWLNCGLAVGGLVVQYGVPVGKVIGWLKNGYKIFGGVSGLINAIKSGAAAAEIGADAAEILGGLLGSGEVVSACS